MDQDTLRHTIGLAGGILGTLLGLLGGAIGMFFAVRNTKGPRERAFVIRACILCLVGVVAYGLGMWIAPSPYQVGLTVVYVLALLIAIRHWNKRQAAIRAEESNHTA